MMPSIFFICKSYFTEIDIEKIDFLRIFFSWCKHDNLSKYFYFTPILKISQFYDVEPQENLYDCFMTFIRSEKK